MQVYVIEGEEVAKSKRAKVLREKPPTDWQRRCWCIGISMQLQDKPGDIPGMLRGSRMIEEFILTGTTPLANVTNLLPRSETGGSSSKVIPQSLV